MDSHYNTVQMPSHLVCLRDATQHALHVTCQVLQPHALWGMEDRKLPWVNSVCMPQQCGSVCNIIARQQAPFRRCMLPAHLHIHDGKRLIDVLARLLAARGEDVLEAPLVFLAGPRARSGRQRKGWEQHLPTLYELQQSCITVHCHTPPVPHACTWKRIMRSSVVISASCLILMAPRCWMYTGRPCDGRARYVMTVSRFAYSEASMQPTPGQVPQLDSFLMTNQLNLHKQRSTSQSPPTILSVLW